ncbi:MAG: MFS transporter [Bacillota bacterium]|nr:MFS transporter [Bacillota bacterium]
MNKHIRFWMWSLLSLTHIIAHFHRLSLNVLADSLMADFNLSGATMGNLAAAYSYTYLLMLVPGGLFVDKFGSRRSAFLITFLMGAGALIFGTSNSIFSLFVGRLLIGFGASVVLINMMKFQSEWYSTDEFATMNGMAIFIGSIGSVIATFPLAYLLNFATWRSISTVAGIISISLALACFIWIKDHPEKLEASGISGEKVNRLRVTIPVGEMFKTALSNKYLWMLFFINFGIYGGYLTFSGAWGVTYLMQVYELTRQQASLYVMPAAAGAMFGAPLAGYISDKLGRRRLIIFMGALLFWLNLALLAVVFGGKPPLFLIYLISFNLGVSVSATMLSLTSAKEKSSSNLVATASGFVNMGNFVGAAFLQIIFGFILQLGWQGTFDGDVPLFPLSAFVNAFYFCLLIAAVSVVMNFILRKHANNSRKISL